MEAEFLQLINYRVVFFPKDDETRQFYVDGLKRGGPLNCAVNSHILGASTAGEASVLPCARRDGQAVAAAARRALGVRRYTYCTDCTTTPPMPTALTTTTKQLMSEDTSCRYTTPTPIGSTSA
eukprot:1172339-Pleurochrysis_carterae.AAC.1